MALIPRVAHRFQRRLALGANLRTDQNFILHINVVGISPLCVCIYTVVTYVLNFCNKTDYESCLATHCFFSTFFLKTGVIAYTINHINLSNYEI